MLLPLVLIGVVAYTVGKNAGKKTEKTKTKDYPKPPLPSVDDLPDALPLPPAADTDYSQAWEQVGFEVEIYPAGAKRYVAPPPVSDGISVAPNCRVVAIGTGFWDRAGALVEALLAQGVTGHNELRAKVLEQFAPACLGSSSNAAKLFREEILERLQESVPKQAQLGVNKNGAPARNGLLVR